MSSFRSTRGLEKRSAPDRLPGWQEQRERFGEISPRNYASLKDGAAVLVQSDVESAWLLFRFRLDEHGRLAGMMAIPIDPSHLPAILGHKETD